MPHSPIKTLILRADAGTGIGAGHVMRCLALAQAWKREGGVVVFVSSCGRDRLAQRIRETADEFVAIEARHPDPADVARTRNVLEDRPGSALVLDGYDFNAVYQESLRAAAARLMVIDDYVHAERYCADLILNQNLRAERLVYPCPPEIQLLLGPKYALLREEYLRWQEWTRETPEVARHVLVTLGGSDPHNVTLDVVRALKRLDAPDLEARVVIGAANPHRATLAAEVNGTSERIQLLEDARDMAELMAWADVAVSAGGTTCWELAFMGVPNVIIILAGNQRGVARGLEEEGVSLVLGEANEVTVDNIVERFTSLMHAPKRRERMSARGRELVDGDGAKRAVAAIRTR